MGLFDKLKGKKSTPAREELLKANEGVPFTTAIIDNKKNGEKLTYNYEKVKCNVIGDTSGLIEGAILYAKKDGVLVNCIREPVAQIENVKLRGMVNDISNEKSSLSSMRVKYLSNDKEYLYCNIGFWTAPIDEDEKENDEDDEEA